MPVQRLWLVGNRIDHRALGRVRLSVSLRLLYAKLGLLLNLLLFWEFILFKLLGAYDKT